MKKMVAVNRDLLIRTVCLLAVTNMFVAKGSELGPSYLAANAVLFQLQYIVAYFFDGLANAGSVFAGKSAGENDPGEFDRTVFISNVHMAWVGAAATLVLLLFHGFIVECFTDHAEIVALCEDYMIWLVVFPLVIGPGLVYFGFFTGATYTAPVRNSMLMALLVFVASYYTAVPAFHNHGLWLSFILFSLCRSVVLFFCIRQLVQNVFASGPETVVEAEGSPEDTTADAGQFSAGVSDGT